MKTLYACSLTACAIATLSHSNFQCSIIEITREEFTTCCVLLKQVSQIMEVPVP